VEAEDLIAGAIRQLQGPGPADAAIKEAHSILQETLTIVHRGAPPFDEAC
jgi:hypothetical protein